MERSKFEIIDVEGLRPHYAKSLCHWVQRLELNHRQALEFVNEATFCVWRLYVAAFALEFESGALGLDQILAGHRAAGTRAIPITCHYTYPRPETTAADTAGPSETGQIKGAGAV